MFAGASLPSEACEISTGIYAVLLQSVAVSGDIISAIWTCVGYTVLLCFTLFKTSSLSKSVFNAH